MTVFVLFKNRLRQAREWLLDYAYWVTLGAMIAVIVGTALYTDRLRQAENVQAAAPAPEVASPSPRADRNPVAAADARARPPSVRCGRGSPRLRRAASRLLRPARALAVA